MLSLELMTVLAGGLAGFLGALIGVGGGVVLVPILNAALGLSFSEARGVSLIGVLGTSSASALAPVSRRLVNPRLATFLLLFSVSGATIGGRFLTLFPDRVYEVIFGVTTAAVAGLMLSRRKQRNILRPGTANLGVFGDHFHDDETDTEVAYRVYRVPLAAIVSFISGMLASLIGIGGGIVIVPALNTLCGVPLRVAAATSVLMVGVTAIPASAANWTHGSISNLHVAGMTCLGAMLGYQVGRYVGPNAPVSWLKTGMALVLAAVAIQYLFLR